MGFEEYIATLEKELCRFRDENRKLKEENQVLRDEQQKLLQIVEQMRLTINRLLGRYVLERQE